MTATATADWTMRRRHGERGQRRRRIRCWRCRLRGLTPGLPYRIDVEAREPGGEVTRATVDRAGGRSVARSGGCRDLRIPIEVVDCGREDSTGAARCGDAATGMPLTFAVPLPRGALRQPAARVSFAASAVDPDADRDGEEAQVRVHARWPDGSARWALLDTGCPGGALSGQSAWSRSPARTLRLPRALKRPDLEPGGRRGNRGQRPRAGDDAAGRRPLRVDRGAPGRGMDDHLPRRRPARRAGQRRAADLRAGRGGAHRGSGAAPGRDPRRGAGRRPERCRAPARFRAGAAPCRPAVAHAHAAAGRGQSAGRRGHARRPEPPGRLRRGRRRHRRCRAREGVAAARALARAAAAVAADPGGGHARRFDGGAGSRRARTPGARARPCLPRGGWGPVAHRRRPRIRPPRHRKRGRPVPAGGPRLLGALPESRCAATPDALAVELLPPLGASRSSSRTSSANGTGSTSGSTGRPGATGSRWAAPSPRS